MDAGDYETNTLVVNNLSSIAFKIYEPVVSQSSVYTFNASDVEFALRNDGHLVYMDVVRRGIWCFYLVTKDPTNTVTSSEQSRLAPTLEVCGYKLGLVGEGAFEPISLQKGRPAGTNPITTPSSSSSNASGALDAATRSAPPFNLPPAGLMPRGSIDSDARHAAPVVGLDPKGYGSVPVKEMHEFFITAVLSSLSTAFCRCSGAISLTPRTLLLPPNTLQPDDGGPVRSPPLSALACFRLYLTTTGSLVISLSVTAMEGLISSADALRSDWYSPSTTVLAAPLGAFASLQGVLDRDYLLGDNASGRSPETQVSRFRPEVADKLSQGRSQLSKLLQLRGISPTILDGCTWLNIQFLKKKPYEYKADGKRTPMTSPAPVISWPSVLCFRKPGGSMLHDLSLAKALGTEGGDFDPLNNAKQWFEGNAEREELFSKRRMREQHDSATREAVTTDAHQQARTDPTPLTLRRISNAGAMTAAAAGAMYPTPPDGVQQAPGVTPSFDVAMSSPPNQSINAAAAGGDSMVIGEGRQSRSFSGGWEADGKREQSDPAFPAGDNLFGDLGEDLFENNELTDADFSFFDQDTGDNGLDLSDLPAMSDAMDLASPANEAGFGSAQGLVPVTDAEHSVPVSSGFAKPELRHARSTLGDEGRQLTSSAHAQTGPVAGMKRQPSPFGPDAVYKRIRASFGGPSAGQSSGPSEHSSRRKSVFEKVVFDPCLSSTNKKYGESGPFGYKLPSKEESDDSPAVEPSGAAAQSLQQRRQKALAGKPVNPGFGELMARITSGLQHNSLNNSPSKNEETFADDDAMSLVSDQDDSSDAPEEPTSPMKYGANRRSADDDNLSLAPSFRDLEHHSTVESPAYAMADLSRLSQPGTPELPVTKFFADPEPWPLQLSCRDEELVTIAQIITEQAVTGSLSLYPKNPAETEPPETRRTVVNAARHSMQCLRSVLPSSLAGAADCQFRPFIEVQDVPLLGQPSRMQPRPAGQGIMLPNLFQIPAPHVELRRYESKLSVLPSAVSFWEGLGLSPSQGPKDINAICVYPDWKGMQDNVVCFLDRLRSIYESLKMGTFDRLLYGADLPSGLFPYSVDKVAASPTSATTPQSSSVMSGAMTKLANDLARFIVTEKNHVIYFVYAQDNPGSIVEACAAFQDLFEKYKKAVADRKKPVSNELVLQLIPMDSIAAETTLAILSPSEYMKLCIETYDRCTIFGDPMPAPAIVLEPPLPRLIEFKPTPSPSANVLHENSCIHIAYARSVDDRWITAAWTDNRGIKQMTASYCLGRRGKPLSNSLEEVTREIWDTTHDLISMWKVHWRVVVTKCGPMEPGEIDGWVSLAQSDTKASISLILMTVDTDPSLQLIPPTPRIPVVMTSAFYTTPVSTPQPVTTVSPEQSGGNPPTPSMTSNPMNTATTPGGGGDNTATEADGDATLVDVTETTWGAVVAHRLNNSSSLTELNPAVASGYLVKRSGARPEDPPVAMEVNVIHSEGNNPRAYEAVLREMLMYFRGLGTLARLRGMTERGTDARPWHVAAAEKGVRALYQLL